MCIRVFFFSFLLFVSSICFSQTKEYLWIGSNLTEIYHKNDKWYYENENNLREIEYAPDMGYFFRPESWHLSKENDRKIPVSFDTLGVFLDTLVLHKRTSQELFIKPEKILPNKFRFFALEYEQVTPYGDAKTTYHLNKYGVFRKSNHRNETLIEKQIDSLQMKQFNKLWRGIDIKNMDKASSWQDQCDGINHSFTFIDQYRKRYNYMAALVRKQLQPLQLFLLALEKQ